MLAEELQTGLRHAGAVCRAAAVVGINSKLDLELHQKIYFILGYICELRAEVLTHSWQGNTDITTNEGRTQVMGREFGKRRRMCIYSKAVVHF